MLLEFKFENYKSFLNETVFSMTPAPKIKDLDFSVLKKKIKGSRNPEKALCSAVIYGPNAAGKSNIIGALDTFKSIVLRGNIKNPTQTDKSENKKNSNSAANNLELIPNNTLKSKKPVCFSIKFIEDEYLFKYMLVIDLGCFMEKNAERRILEESLSLNNTELFRRTETVILGENLKKYKKLSNPKIFEKPFMDFIEAMATSSLNPTDLFLTNGFKTIVSPKISQLVCDWFDNKLNTIYDSYNYESYLDSSCFNSNIENALFINNDLEAAAKSIGITSNHIGYICKNNQIVLSSAFDGEMGGFVLPAKLIESVGTIKFMNFIYPLLCVIKNGGTLVIDELDCSLHSMVIMDIINIFHNDEINVNNAQLIFNSQNPVFLNADLYRRDEIKFVERDDEGISYHYSLADFILENNKQVRKGADYMKNYFIDRYGAIKEINLSPLFESIINNKDFYIQEKRKCC